MWKSKSASMKDKEKRRGFNVSAYITRGFDTGTLQLTETEL